MSVHHRPSSGPESGTAYYQTISQDEVNFDEERAPILDVEEDEDTSADDFLTQEHLASHDRRIYWIHVILGSAVLLPWNGEPRSPLYPHSGLSRRCIALITATPFFLSRLEGSSLRSTFSSYLSTTFTIANFGFLAHATSTSRQVCYVL